MALNGHSNGHSNGHHHQTNGTGNGFANGHHSTNGSSNGSSTSSTGSDGMIEWAVGFASKEGKYLTAESFGYKVNVTGNSLKKKQIWVLEQDGAAPDLVFLRSRQGRYLSADKHGNVSCESEDRGAAERFLVEISDDGRWAFRSDLYGYYLGGRGDNLKCSAKTADDGCLWHVHLAAHPQVHLRNVNRKRYARLRDGELQVTENMPWGQAALITIEYRGGQYAVRSCDGKYLARDGKLSPTCDRDALYRLEFHAGYMAFKDRSGRYLTAVGPNATLRTRNTTVARDEMFQLVESQLQAAFVAHNGKLVSTKTGMDISANQDTEEVTDTEIFQIEMDRNSGKWLIRASNDKYWTVEAGSGIQAKPISPSTRMQQQFDVSWLGEGRVALLAGNGRYVTAKANGQVFAISDNPGEKEEMEFHVMNRPLLVLRGEHGYVGAKSQASSKMECNKSAWDTILVEQNQQGSYYFKDVQGKFWRLTDDGHVFADGIQGDAFQLELRDQSRFAIKTSNGFYMQGEQNGNFRAISDKISAATLWEF